MKVLAIPKVLEYMENLIPLLYEKGYFGFRETAKKYVDELYNEILDTLPFQPHKPAPKYFDKYGKNLEYAFFTKNKRTTWYVFFRVYKIDGEEIYQVRYIANNHTIAQFL